MSESDLREASSDPQCPFTYEELWDMHFGPPGPSLSELIEQLEAEWRQTGAADELPTDQPPPPGDST